jgi:hypothetical protein
MMSIKKLVIAKYAGAALIGLFMAKTSFVVADAGYCEHCEQVWDPIFFPNGGGYYCMGGELPQPYECATWEVTGGNNWWCEHSTSARCYRTPGGLIASS